MRSTKAYHIIFSIGQSILATFFLFQSCRKLVTIDPPVNSITTQQVFADSSQAAAVISGLYSNMTNDQSTTPLFCNGLMTTFGGMYSDELVPFRTNQFYTNIIAVNNFPSFYLWDNPYFYIYQANSCIEGIEGNSNIPENVKKQFTGEAKFIRAFIYFYLYNLYGDVPYLSTTSWDQNAKMPRTSIQLGYQNIINDLKQAQELLSSDYSFSSNERIRANKWAATALLSRVYLYTSDWANSESEANKVINNSSLFSLNPDLNNVFSKNNSEAILQWNINTSLNPFNVTVEGYNLLPYPSGRPQYYLSNQLLNDFDSSDMRKAAWVKTNTYQGTDYSFANKYKMGSNDIVENGPTTEYYTVLRLAEQYLIRSEAKAHQNNLTGSIADLNVIRKRAGLPDLSLSLSQSQVFSAIEHERRIELFAEWGHRWFDIKRTGRVDAIMGVVTPQKAGQAWQSFRQLLPIPYTELQKNPFLTQNPGYN